MKKTLIYSTGAILLTSISSAILSSAQPSVAQDNTPQILMHHQEQLDNHEARITNAESDITGLQQNTNTQPSSDRQPIPVVSPAPAEPTTDPQPEPEPVVVTSYRQIPVENSEDVDCELSYSDGTTYRWHWQRVEYNQGTKITHTSDKCDDSVIGKRK